MRSLTHTQIMANAPMSKKRAYFDNLFCSIAADTERRAVGAENLKKQAELQQRELD